jgi:hypothetical protein
MSAPLLLASPRIACVNALVGHRLRVEVGDDTLPVTATPGALEPAVAVMAVGVTLVTVAETGRADSRAGLKQVPLTVMMRPPLTFAQMGETLETGAGRVTTDDLRQRLRQYGHRCCP